MQRFAAQSSGRRNLSHVAVLIGLLAGTACSDVPTDAKSIRPPASPSRSAAAFPSGLATLRWQRLGRDLVVGHLQGPLGASRIYALLGMAQYAAIVSVDESAAVTELPQDGQDTGQGFGPGGRSRFELERGAVVGASARLLAFIYPDSATFIAQRVADETDAGPGDTHPFFSRGIEAGQAMGDVMVAWAKSDRFNAPFTGTIPTGPGKWIAHGPPVGPTEGSVRPYYMSSGSQFRPPPPPEFLSDAYNTALHEVRSIADTRTAEQTAIALFWGLNAGTPSALGHWDEIAAPYIEAHGLDEREAAHVLALANTAAVDALIACFDAKYTYYMIRPSEADPQISLALALPNHPSYPSAHSCVSAAAGTVLSTFFPEHADTIQSMVVEAGLSRIYAGIHYRFDIETGQQLGREAAQLALDTDRTSGILSVIR